MRRKTLFTIDERWFASPWVRLGLFGITILGLCLIFGYQDLLFEMPMGLHHWRQTDCTSLAANYHKHGMHFFEPQIYHVLGGEGKAVAEFPIIYYFVAFLYKVFGKHEFLFRLVNLSIVFIGLWHVFKLGIMLLKDTLLSLLITGVVFTSTVLAVYSINFLPDGPAFGLVMTGCYFFYRFAQEGRTRDFMIAMAVFTLGGLLKATTFQSAGIVGILFLAEWTFGARLHSDRKIFTDKWWKFLGVGILSFGIIAGWYLWAIQYNKANSSIYFSTKMWPIWEMTGPEIAQTLDLMMYYWGNDYFYRRFWPFIGLLSLMPVLFYRFVPRTAGLITLGLLGTSGLFLFFWYFAFKNHDYYFIHFLPFFVWMLFLSIKTLRNKFPALEKSLLPAFFMLIVLVLSARNTHIQFDKRFEPDGVHYSSVNEHLFTIAPYLDSLGISREDKIVSLPDETPNTSLYMMDRPGWTELYHPDFKREYLARFVESGAQFLVISEPEWLTHPAVEGFTSKQIGQYHDIAIFDLR